MKPTRWILHLAFAVLVVSHLYHVTRGHPETAWPAWTIGHDHYDVDPETGELSRLFPDDETELLDRYLDQDPAADAGLEVCGICRSAVRGGPSELCHPCEGPPPTDPCADVPRPGCLALPGGECGSHRYDSPAYHCMVREFPLRGKEHLEVTQ